MAKKLRLGWSLDRKYVFVGHLLKDGGWSETKQDVTEDFFEAIIVKYAGNPATIHVVGNDGNEEVYQVLVRNIKELEPRKVVATTIDEENDNWERLGTDQDRL